MDWPDLISSFRVCLSEVTSEDPPEEEDQQKQQIVKLKHKLIELHGRMKVSLDSPDDTDTGANSNSEQEGKEEPDEPPISNKCTEDLLKLSRNVLSHPDLRRECGALSAQLLAELAKTEKGRRIALAEGVVEACESCLEDQASLEKGGLETVVQICRVLGNLCFECSEGRAQIIASKCLEYLLTVSNNKERVKHEDPGQRLPVILPGLLFNFCNESTESIKKTGSVGLIPVISHNILSTETNDAVFNASLNFLSSILHDPHGKDAIQKDKHFPTALDHVLEYTTSPEVIDTALEMLKSVAEDQNLVLQLVNTPLVSTLVQHIVGRWSDEEFEVLRGVACDVLVVILSHDANIAFVYAQDNGKLLNTFIEWLQSDDDVLQVCACLSLGNFANSPENCAILLSKGASQMLIGLLKSNQNPQTDLKMQHALLGTLRNLAVDAGSRKQLIHEGLLTPCQSLIERLPLSAAPVVFKLLSTLRLAIEGDREAAKVVGGNASNLVELINWGNNDAQAIRAEVSRLIAAIIKNSQSSQIMESLCVLGGLALVTPMLTSTHLRMQNEALIALSITAAALDQDRVHAHLHTDLVINAIKNCLCKSDSPEEVKKNAVTLTLQLMKAETEEFKKMLQDLNFKQEVMANDKAMDIQEVRDLIQKL